MDKKTRKWLNEKVTITLTRNKMFDLAGIIAENDLYERDFLKIKDRKIRKLFRESFIKRHKLWLEITHKAERGRGK